MVVLIMSNLFNVGELCRIKIRMDRVSKLNGSGTVMHVDMCSIKKDKVAINIQWH